MEHLKSIDWKSIYLILQIVVAASTAITVLYKFGGFFYKKILEEYEYFRKMHRMIDTIYAEVTPNHGSSIKDKINKIHEKLSENTRVTERILYRQRWLLDNRDEPIFESDGNGEYTWVNKKYCVLTGYTMEEFCKNGWYNVVHEKDRERVTAEWTAAIKDKRDSHMNYKIVCKNNNVYKIHADATRNADGGYIGTLRVEKRIDEIDD